MFEILGKQTYSVPAQGLFMNQFMNQLIHKRFWPVICEQWFIHYINMTEYLSGISQNNLESPRKWRKCKLVSGATHVGCHKGLCGKRHELTVNHPRTSADERMLSGRRAFLIVWWSVAGFGRFSLTFRFSMNSHLGHSRAWIPACSPTAALLHRCFPSNLSTTMQGAIVKLRGASSELCTLFIWSV